MQLMRIAMLGLLGHFLIAPVFGLSAEDWCRARKHEIAGEYALCRAMAEATSIGNGKYPDYSKCVDTLLAAWQTTEKTTKKYGGTCVDSISDKDMLEVLSTNFDTIAGALLGRGIPFCGAFPASGQTTSYGANSDGNVQAGAPMSFTDNGDGTITDNNTGLMWEKKDNSGGIHDFDNLYTWCIDDDDNNDCDNGTGAMDGTIASVFLAALNSGFAGYTDWRIPNAKEIQSIADFEHLPAVHPIFHQPATCTGCTDITLPGCSCTDTLSTYWTSTTYLSFDNNMAKLFGPINASVMNYWKGSSQGVRAVRGGL